MIPESSPQTDAAAAVTASGHDEGGRGAAGSTDPHAQVDVFSGRLGWGARPAVLIIDLVRAYTEPQGPFAVPNPELVVGATAELVAAARRGGYPVLWTVVRYSPGLPEAGLFASKVPGLAAFAEDADGDWGELALAPVPGELVVTKHYASAFFGTSLASTLHAAGIDTLLIGGVSTSGCVRATATDALNLGFRPLVIRQACADRRPDLHESNLNDLDAKYADVMDLTDSLRHLENRV